MSYTFYNFLNNLQNASKLQKTKIIAKQTKLIMQIINILIKEGFIRGYTYTPQNKLIIFLKNKYTSTQVINSINIISKPGKRVYLKNTQIFKNKDFSNLFIISTSRGLMTINQAKKYNYGGEIICKIF